jgi:hypothetical protein
MVPRRGTRLEEAVAVRRAWGFWVPETNMHENTFGFVSFLSIAALLAASPAGADQPAICTSQQLEAIYARRGAVVEVEGPSIRMETGVVVGRRRVLTSFFAVEPGRGIEVIHAGMRYAVIGITANQPHDLALLELERPLAVEPLPLSAAKLSIGDPVATLGRTWDGDRPTQDVRPGVVSSDDGGWRASSLSGGARSPVLDCEGRVIGLARGWGDGFDAVGPAIDLLSDRDAEDYAGNWSMAHFAATFPIQVAQEKNVDGSRDAYFGVGLGTALIGHDRLYLPFRLSLLVMPGEDRPDGVWKRTGMRLQAETGIGYRVMLAGGAWATYLVPQIGLAGGLDWLEHRRSHHTVTESGCSPSSPCEATMQTDTRSRTAFYLRPTAGLALHTGLVELSYQLLLDVERIEGSVHQFGMGVVF